MDTPSAQRPLEYQSDAQRLTGTPTSQSMWGYSLMFSAEHFLCSRRRPQSVPSTHPSRGAATSATPASSRPHRHPAAPRHQCRRSRGAPSQPSRHSSSPPPTALCHAHRQHSSPCCGLPCAGS
ncbi:regulator of sigma E protease [Trypanosoma cruzi]|nr:regulator of sigma E protease [Trypanosoma cruzi]